MPSIINFENEKIEIFLTSITNFLVQNYPVIGIRKKKEFENLYDIDPDIIEENIKVWIEKFGGFDKLKNESLNYNTINWESLINIGAFPLNSNS